MSPTPDPTIVDDCVGRFGDTCTPTPELNESGQHLANLYQSLEPGAIDPNTLHAQQPLILDKLQALGLITEPGFPWNIVIATLLVTAALIAVALGVSHLVERRRAAVPADAAVGTEG